MCRDGLQILFFIFGAYPANGHFALIGRREKMIRSYHGRHGPAREPDPSHKLCRYLRSMTSGARPADIRY